MNGIRDGVLIFHSIHRVMQAEKVLKKAGFPVRLMPVPRKLSSDCGLAITFPTDRGGGVREALEHAGCPPAEAYRLVGEEYQPLG